jgi:hypothetical protein
MSNEVTITTFTQIFFLTTPFMRQLFLLIVLLCSAAFAKAQTMIPLPAHANQYTGTVRGFWFTAPTNFTIVGLRMPADAGTGTQYIHLMKINDATPVAWPSNSSNFTTLAYINNAPNGVIQTVNIPVTAGDHIGVLGHAGSSVINSYSSPATSYPTTIGTMNTSMYRLLYQGSLLSGAAPNYSWEVGSYAMGRVEVYYITGPPCPAPGSLNATGITSTAANLSWGAVTGSTGYQWAVTTSAAPPSSGTTSTTGTSATKTGLTPATQYYLHVRNMCSSTNPSVWASYGFMTLPPCQPPVGFHVTNLEPTSTDINWDPWPSAQTYDVLVDQSNQTPTSTTGAINTALTTIPWSPLLENTWYYVHIRSNCAGGEQSGWSLDSFLTPIPCRPPDIKIDHVNTDEAVAYWAPVPTATHYEYAITTSAAPPQIGTEYKFTSLHTSALDDGKDYYVHVRSHCNSIGIVDASPWATASFKTFPVSVGNLANGVFGIAAYPNPVKNELTVEVSAGSGNAVMSLTDVSGKVLQRVQVTTAKTNFDMSGLASGVYFIKYDDEAHNELIKITRQ